MNQLAWAKEYVKWADALTGLKEIVPKETWLYELAKAIIEDSKEKTDE